MSPGDIRGARRALGLTQVVRLKPEIEACENYLEAGMRARIVNVREQQDDVFVVTFDQGEFEKVNKPFESSNYFDEKGVARLNAREAGQYKPVDDYFLPGPSGWDAYFEVEAPTPAAAKIAAAFAGREDKDRGYVSWLEDELARAVAAGHDLTSDKPHPTE